MSTIGEERRNNPRLQVPSVDDYVELMNNLNLPNPKMMDVAVPANMHIGLPQDEVAREGLGGVGGCGAEAARPARRGAGRPPGAKRARAARHDPRRAASFPIPTLDDNVKPGGMLTQLGSMQKLVFFCAFGERSAMAVTCRAGGRHRLGLPHRGRHRRLEEGRRAGRALSA